MSGKTVEQKLSNTDGSLIREGCCFRPLRKQSLYTYSFVVFLVKDPSNRHQWCAILPPLHELCGALQKSCQLFYTEREQIYTTYAYNNISTYCLLFGTCHTSCKNSFMSSTVPFHANKTSPLFWKVSYLIQSVHHQVLCNDILQVRFVCSSQSQPTVYITEDIFRSPETLRLLYRDKKNSFLHDETLCSPPKTVSFVLVIKRRIGLVTAKC